MSCCRASRFDLLHVMIDEPNDNLDYQIASHIVGVHMRRDAAFAVPYDMRQVQRYLKYARAFRPEMTVEARIWSPAKALGQLTFPCLSC